MNKKIILAMLLIPLASAATFEDVDTQMHQQQNFAFDGADTFALFERAFTHNETNDVFVQLANTDSPFLGETGYSIDVSYSINSAPLQILEAGVNSTTPTVGFATIAGDEILMQFNLTFPSTRDVGLIDVSPIIVSDLNESAAGSGGVQNPSIGSTFSLYFYDSASDSDVDQLPDAWEMDFFGHLFFLASDDPDEDGYNNLEEYQAGTDPNNAASHPEETVITVGGGKVSDRDISAALGGLVIIGIAAVLWVFFAVDRTRKDPGEQLAAIIMGSFAIIFFVVFALLSGLDYLNLANHNWAFWSTVGVTWLQWLTMLLGWIVILLAGTAVLLVTKQAKEEHALVWIALGVVVWGFVGILVFAVFDVPILV